MHGPPTDFGGLADRLRRELRRCDVEEDIGAGGFQADDLGIDGGIGRFIRQLGDNLDLVADRILQTLDVVLTVVVVLIEDRDLAIGMVLQDIFAVDAAFALVVRLPAHGPGEVHRIAESRRAGGDEKLRHLFAVHITRDRRVVGGPQAVEDKQHFVALDELPRLLDGLRRAVAVVVGDEIDLAAVDAALGVHLVEVSGDGLADGPVGGGRPAIGADVSDLDLRIARAGVVFFLRERGAGPSDGEAEHRGRQQTRCEARHGFPPIVSAGSLQEPVEKKADRSTEPRRDQINDQYQYDAENGAGQALRYVLGDVGHEQNEQAAEKRAGDRADAADDESDEERDRKQEGKAVRRHELDGERAERAGDAGIERAQAEGQRLVKLDRNTHRARGDGIVADRHHGAAAAAVHKIIGAEENQEGHRGSKEIEPLIRIEGQAERCIWFVQYDALHTAGPGFEWRRLQDLRRRGR